ncbi:MAG: DegT/DnrJ/EryC1/StrS family aminotransferase [Pseudomonadota bacterium]
MKLPFEPEYRRRYQALLEEIFEGDFLSEGAMVRKFEEDFARLAGPGLHAAAAANCGLGLLALLEFVGVEGREVIVPSNTFMATPLAAARAGAKVVFADCNREDLCLSLADLKKKVTPRVKAVVLVHIGGHLAFETEEIASWLEEREISLIEDCAHAHGGTWRGRAAGSFGIGGVYSFYATKTMPLGEGGMVVSRFPEAIEFFKKWRNYGKFDYQIKGFNARMNEVTAALGLVQLERLPRVLAWKRDLARKYDLIFENRVKLPPGMVSGYYKYIVFDAAPREQTGKVFGEPCHELSGLHLDLPNTAWVKDHHACPPIYYGWDGADLSPDELARRLLQ